jgi:hypothetical protein
MNVSEVVAATPLALQYIGNEPLATTATTDPVVTPVGKAPLDPVVRTLNAVAVTMAPLVFPISH